MKALWDGVSMEFPMPAKKYVVVELTESEDLNHESFDTYEEALDYVEETNMKCLIIGSEGVEDHT
jgi:dihydrofolate reductase